MSSEFWDHSVEIIRRMKSPWRPHPSEIRALGEWIAELFPHPRGRGPRVSALLLGVTPEIASLPFREHVHLTAIERATGMIRAFWPGCEPGRRALVRADWDAPPFREEAFDLVIGDGVFNTRRYPDGYLALAVTLRSLLRPDGILLVRGFLQLDPREEPAHVVAEYRAGELCDYDALRFRFQTSLQASAADGIWGSKEFLDGELVARGVELGELYRRTGYRPPNPPPRMARQGAAARLRVSYPTLPEYERVFTRHFRLLDRRHGEHALASRCPIFALAPKP